MPGSILGPLYSQSQTHKALHVTEPVTVIQQHQVRRDAEDRRKKTLSPLTVCKVAKEVERGVGEALLIW